MKAPGTTPDALKAILILHKAMLAGQLIFAAIAFYLVYSMSFTAGLQPYVGQALQVTAIILSGVGFYTGNFLFKKKLMKIKEIQMSPKEKFDLYRNTCILQWILLEVPCVFVTACFLLTGNYAFFALAIVLLLLFTIMAPSKLKMVFHLQLSEEEIEEL